jgi:hypothetical protein
MSLSLPSVTELSEAPELAVLHALDAALRAAERALLAAHPELEEVDLNQEPPPLTLLAGLADSLLTQLAGVDAGISRYAAAARHRLVPGVHEEF